MRSVGTGDGRKTPVPFYDYLRENYVIRLLQSIKPLFPDGSKFEIRNDYHDYCLLIDWELPEIKGGHLVRSKKIILLIDRDTIDDFMRDLKPAWRRLVEIRLRQYVARKLRFFNPDPDPSTDQGQEELWVVTNRILGETA